MNYRYILEPYGGAGSRLMCPNCRHRRNTFKRYIDTETQSYLADHVGLCDRIDSCGYHYPPREYFADNPHLRPGARQWPHNQTPAEPKTGYTFLPWQYVSNTMRQYDKNNFVHFLSRLFNGDTARYLAFKYKIGTSRHWPGATIFWQVDRDENVRTGKVMLYDKTNCRRVKEPFNHITWVHSLLSPKSEARSLKSEVDSPKSDLTQDSGLKTYDLKQCFFGEHLLDFEPGKTVAIVESEKTAVIASIYHPAYLWLAAGSADGLSLEKCRALEGREVILFPDVNNYAKWHDKARYLNNKLFSTTFRTDKTLELAATPQTRTRGTDIADQWIDEKLLQWEVEREMD
jgi:hypothetical protein